MHSRCFNAFKLESDAVTHHAGEIHHAEVLRLHIHLKISDPMFQLFKLAKLGYKLFLCRSKFVICFAGGFHIVPVCQSQRIDSGQGFDHIVHSLCCVYIGIQFCNSVFRINQNLQIGHQRFLRGGQTIKRFACSIHHRLIRKLQGAHGRQCVDLRYNRIGSIGVDDTLYRIQSVLQRGLQRAVAQLIHKSLCRIHVELHKRALCLNNSVASCGSQIDIVIDGIDDILLILHTLQQRRFHGTIL